MYILKQTNLLKFGIISLGIIVALFCFYVVVGFLGIQFLMEPYQYGAFFAWVIIPNLRRFVCFNIYILLHHYFLNINFPLYFFR